MVLVVMVLPPLPGAKKAFLLTNPDQSQWTSCQNQALKELIPLMLQAHDPNKTTNDIIT